MTTRQDARAVGSSAGAPPPHHTDPEEHTVTTPTTEPDIPEPTIRPTRYEVSVLPEDDINYRWHVVEILYLGKGQWAVYHRAYGMCLGVDGTWDDGLKEHGRGEAWLAAHRHDLDTARRLAEQAAPNVVANGRLPDGTWVGLDAAGAEGSAR